MGGDDVVIGENAESLILPDLFIEVRVYDRWSIRAD
jgi:hypothetical protein